jgi:capsular polysaccharide biosynthesis protein
VSDNSQTQDYDIRMTLAAIRRFWWLVVLAPTIIFIALSVRNLTADYQSTFRASVLIPGDTEIPGSAERPELMILDDLGPVVESRAFAEIVAAQAGLPVDDVLGSLSVERYSRIATVTAHDPDGSRALAIANAAAAVFPQAVNTFMVAAGGQQATVLIIDPPSEAVKGAENKWTITAIATMVGFAIGLFACLVLDASLPSRRTAALS